MKSLKHLVTISKSDFLKKNPKNNENNIYSLDSLIIGGGIGGLEVGYQLSKKNKQSRIGIFEQSDYLGGRVRTFHDTYKNTKFSYEAGAARFNDNHKSLISVIKRCKLSKNKIKIPSFWVFKPTEKFKKIAETLPYNNVHELINALINHYDKPKFKKYLQNTTFLEACRDLYGPKVAAYLKAAYSYYSEIMVFNAYNSIKTLKNDLGEHNQFYILNGGLSTLTNCIATDFLAKTIKTNAQTKAHTIQNNKFICLRMQVQSWKYDDKTKLFYVTILNLEDNTKIKVATKNLIMATDGKSIKRWKPQLKQINPEILTVMKHVTSEPLLRVYIIYESKWFKNYGKVVTDSLIKYMIPVNAKLGLVMISYTDGAYVRRMMKEIENGTQKKAIYESLKEIFPDDKIEKNPKYIKNEYWETGAVYWNKGADSEKMSKFMLKPSKKHNLYICGDSFSENQAWTDGALSTAHKICELIN